MKPIRVLERAQTSEGDPLTLSERDGDYTIRIGSMELMSTRRHASEERLAERACAHLTDRRGARVLIGGLGFGFTLRACLTALPPDAEVVVAELNEAVITWNRNPAYPLAAEPLRDPRVRLVNADVARVIAQGPYDAIMLDVDNGPEALCAPANAALYDAGGLARARSVLRPGGCLAIWSAGPADTFPKRFRAAGYEVEVERAFAHGTTGGRHTLFFGHRR